MRVLNEVETGEVSGGTFGLLACLFGSLPKITICKPAPKCEPKCPPAPPKHC